MNKQSAVIKAVCISEKKGQQKHPVERVRLRPEHGIEGDAHAGNWHRQVSLLGQESVDRLQEKISIPLFPGAFAENILCEGIELYKLPARRCARSRRSARSATPTAPSAGRRETASCRGRGSLRSSSRRARPGSVI